MPKQVVFISSVIFINPSKIGQRLKIFLINHTMKEVLCYCTSFKDGIQTCLQTNDTLSDEFFFETRCFDALMQYYPIKHDKRNLVIYMSPSD